MSISFYSAIAAFLWFDLFVLLFSFLRWKLNLLLGYQIFPLVFLVVLSLSRLLIPVELPFVIIIDSSHVMPFFLDPLRDVLFSVGGRAVTVGWLLLFGVSLVAVVLLVRFLVLTRQKLRYLGCFIPTEDQRLLDIFARVKQSAPSTRDCTLCVSDGPSGPCVFGIFHTTILLPQAVCSLSDEDIYYVLKHEWQHHRGRDALVKLLIQLLCCLMWWNPFVYLLKRDLNQTLELKCDAKAVQGLGEAQKAQYAEALLHVFAMFGRQTEERKSWMAVPFVEETAQGKNAVNRNVLQRFDALLKDEPRNKKIGGVCIAVLTVLFCLSFCFLVQPSRLPTEEDLGIGPGEGEFVKMEDVSPESSFIVDNKDGTYSLFLNGEYVFDLTKQDLENEFYQSLSIISEEP